MGKSRVRFLRQKCKSGPRLSRVQSPVKPEKLFQFLHLPRVGAGHLGAQIEARISDAVSLLQTGAAPSITSAILL